MQVSHTTASERNKELKSKQQDVCLQNPEILREVANSTPIEINPSKIPSINHSDRWRRKQTRVRTAIGHVHWRMILPPSEKPKMVSGSVSRIDTEILRLHTKSRNNSDYLENSITTSKILAIIPRMKDLKRFF